MGKSPASFLITLLLHPIESESKFDLLVAANSFLSPCVKLCLESAASYRSFVTILGSGPPPPGPPPPDLASP
jgi:hypothetical protein